MLKLVQCEFAKLKRKKIIPLVFLSAFLFPIPITFLMATPRMLEKYPNKSVLFDGLFNMVMGYQSQTILSILQRGHFCGGVR